MDAIKLYLKDIKDIPLLTPEQEVSFSRKALKGDSDAREVMIRSNLRLVITIAKRYNHLGLPMMDLIEEGNLGLMKAVTKFNPNKGYRFSTYAAWWIRQYITRAIANQGKLVRIPVYMIETISRWKKISEQLTHKLGRKPKLREVAQVMELPVRKVKEISELMSKTSSLDTPISEEGEGEFIDLLEDDRTRSATEELSLVLQQESVTKLLARMNERERKIIQMRYGLHDGVPHTLKEIAGQMNVTRERVRQIESVALRKLRVMMAEREAT